MHKIKYWTLHFSYTLLIAFFPCSASLFLALSFCQKPFIAVISFFNCHGIIYEKLTCQEREMMNLALTLTFLSYRKLKI